MERTPEINLVPDVDLEGIETEAQAEHEVKVSSSQSFDQLYDALDQIGGISGAKTFKPEELRNIIEKVRNNKAELIDITRTYGLRNKVAELLKTDPVYQQFAFIPVTNHEE